MSVHQDTKPAGEATSPVPTVATSERAPAFLWRTSNGRSVKVSATAYFLLTQDAAGHTAHEVAARLSDRLGRAVTEAEAGAALDAVRRRIGAIERQTGAAKPLGLWWRGRVLPKQATVVVARRLSYAFHPVGMSVLFGFLTYVAVRDHTALLTANPGGIMSSPATFWPGYGLVAFSMLCHELGHASAAARYGARVDTVGIGVYWLYPVAYSDVSSAWALTRRQRVAVDLGGLYFQFIVAACYLELYRLTGWAPFRLAPVGILGVAVVMLVPLFKFDGYWLLADALGVANLNRQARRVVADLVRSPRRRSRAAFPWPKRVSAALAVYGSLGTATMALILAGLVSRTGRLFQSYPARISGLVHDLASPPHHLASGRMQSVFLSTYVMFGLTVGMVGYGLRGWRALRARSRPSGRTVS